MDIFPFLLGGCAQREVEQDAQLCKEEVFGEAMPLFAIPPLDQRQGVYQQIINDGILSFPSPQPRDWKLGSIMEHQFKLDLTTNPALEDEYKKIYALCNGKLRFITATSFQDTLGFDLATIFGARPHDEIGVLELSTHDLGINLNVPENWREFLPESLNSNLNIYYLNFDWNRQADYLKSLIDCYVKWDAAKRTFNENHVSEEFDGWQERYYDNFIKDYDFYINVAGGATLGETDKDVYNSGNEIYRLSVFFIERFTDEQNKADLKDFSPQLGTFFKLRSRVPKLRSTVGGAHVIDANSGSMAGHPISFHYTGIPLQSSRVDFIDQTTFAKKDQGPLGFDPDQYPSALAYRLPPTAAQLEIMSTKGIIRQENEFKVFNPDCVYLEFHIPQNDIEFIPPITTPDQPEVSAQISLAEGTTSSLIEIIELDSGVTVQELLLESFDCVLVPVKFWNLHLLTGSLDVKAINNGLLADEVLQSANRILGSQANVYLYANNPEAELPIVQLTTQTVSERDAKYTSLDVNYTDHQKVIQSILKNSDSELNVIWTFKLVDFSDLRKETLGITLDFSNLPPAEFPDYKNPYILIGVTDNYTDEDRGRVLAHEFCHWIRYQNMTHLTTEESENFDDLSKGQDGYYFNLMQAKNATDQDLITTQQARIISQYARKIQGSIPHSE